jgi:hypothetical protein
LVRPAPVNDEIPTEDEIINAVFRLKNNKASGPSGMKAEHFKDWFFEKYPQPVPGTTAFLPREELSTLGNGTGTFSRLATSHNTTQTQNKDNNNINNNSDKICEKTHRS